MKWDDGTILDEKTFLETETLLNGPLWQIHRGDLHAVMLEYALSIGVHVVMGARVRDYNADTPSVTLENGTIMGADVILAADGL